MVNHSNQSQHSFSPAEKLTRADDLMSDILDCFLWPSTNPPKKTIKFTTDYRRPRALNINDLKEIIHSVQTGQLRNLTEATTLIRQLPAVHSYMSNAEPPRLAKHIGLYLQLFLPKCGIKFCETDRYNQTKQVPKLEPPSDPSNLSSTPSLKTRKTKLKIRSSELRDLLGSSDLSSSSSRLKQIRDKHSTSSSSNHPTHLAVFATRDYSPHDIVVGCEGSFADLTEEEDLKLRSNAHQPTNANLSSSQLPRQNTDFSHIVNSRGKFQVFCGPARFVNHDCNNNVELLREGFTIKFKVTRPIKAGQEILTSYGMNYFGEKNCECMCLTCERNGKGFYSQDIPAHQADQSPSEHTSTATVIKPEPSDQSSSGLPPLCLSPDNTDLSSLADSSEGRASQTPALERSPNTSHSNTPSKVRRQLAASYNSSLSQQSQPSHSGSSSTRRQKKAKSDKDHLANLCPNGFVSPIKFTPTRDLTQPIYNLAKCQSCPDLAEFKAPHPSFQSAGSEEASGLADQSKPLPVRRRTYWITTKQKQMGLVPWDSTPSPAVGSNGHQPYSPATPSLLGPSRRDSAPVDTHSISSTTSSSSKRRKIEFRSDRLPIRSYWVSTRDKQLGIVPWEAHRNDPTKDETTIPVSTRSTRAARRASEGGMTIVGFPTAPRGSKLSYRVFQKGTQEAALLNTAIGRELLGFRPQTGRRKNAKAQSQQAPLTKSEESPNVVISGGPASVSPGAENELMDPLDELSSFLSLSTPPPAERLAENTGLLQAPHGDNHVDHEAKDSDDDDDQEISAVLGAPKRGQEPGLATPQDQKPLLVSSVG